MQEDQGFHKIFGSNRENFEQMALEIFRFQAGNNPVYKAFTLALKIDPFSVASLSGIPFLPVRFFKTHEVRSGSFAPTTIFESSGTSGTVNSRHYVKDLGLYEESFIRGFELFYGPVKDLCILGLLPSYLERNNSSLVYMVDKLIRLSGHPQSGFYLDEWDKLDKTLEELEKDKQKTILIGVTFALLDFAQKHPRPLKHTSIMETGGMKGRKKEMIREEVHMVLKNAFGLDSIHSEYGMTELLSQAYSKGEGLFFCPPWMRILIRDEEDPFLVRPQGAGTINVIDLANIYSCSFIATDDAGKLNADGCFEVLGRVDGSDLRGCSLLTV
jgi:phenylacetate-coenzyme A ligase PaaK-like adenylate-forming protein